MKKLETVLVTAERQGSRNITIFGTRINGVVFPVGQRETIKNYLAKKFGNIADLIVVRNFENQDVIMWLEVRFHLYLRSVKRELRRFGRVLERLGVTEKSILCSPRLV